MEDNPYLAFVDMLGNTAMSHGMTFGKVTAAVPLKVLVGGNTMERGELLCNTALLGGADPIWKVGEQLLMLPIEEAQRYIIICKVVEL